MKKLTSPFYLHILHILSGILVHCQGQLQFPIKIATQSHAYGTSTADRAIDNDPNTCSLAAVDGGSSEYGWWQVDLGDVFTIYSVTITSGTRDGVDPAYDQNFVIFTGMTNTTNYVASQLTTCYYFNNGSYLTPGIPTTFTCSPNPLYGRYVTIKRTGGFRQDALGLCDVRIFYNYTDGFIELLNLQTSQTGGYNFNGVVLDSVNANDWNLQSCSEPINDNGYPNWYIDLQDAYSVTGLLAFNQDSAATFNTQPTYLSYFYVRVGNSTDLRTQTQCCYYDGVAPVGGNASCNCQTPIVGRYVSIERVNGDNRKALVICEVFIWGYKSQASTPSTSSSSSTPPTSGSTASNPRTPGVSSASTRITIGSVTSNSTGNSTFISEPVSGIDGKTRTTIICVVVIIGGLLLVGGGAVLIYFLLRKLRKGGSVRNGINPIAKFRTIEILTTRRPSAHHQLSRVSSDREVLTKQIRESDLPSYVENKKTDMGRFKVEFKKLPEDESREANMGRKSDNKPKNRFANVLPYDHTIVPLEIEEYDDPEGDYINANYIMGYKNVDKMYIATQGPRPNTVDDFWRMILQQNVNLIIMTTSLMEGGKKKCERYWPEKLNSVQTFHKISVTLVVEEMYAYYAYREMIVHDERQEDVTPRTVRQMHFLTWSDKTRPDHFLSLLSFRRKVRALQRDSTGPVVIHCSAGIGRTGTYLALDYLLEQVKDEHECSIFGCVEELRYQRMGMVQTTEQYIFLHEALVDGVQAGDTGIPCSDFIKRFVEMAKPWPDGSLSTLEQQFVLLKKLKVFRTEKYSSGIEKANISKNRDMDIVAYDDGRPHLDSTYYNGTDYVNAVYADSYRMKDAFVLTQWPLPETIVDFWRLLWDHRLKTIVLLNELDPNDKSCPVYWPEEAATEAYGPFEVEASGTKEASQNVVLKEFTLTNTKEKRADSLTIRQYHVKGWPNEISTPANSALLLELINVLMTNSNRDPVVVQCTNGASRSGLLAAAMYLVDMMKIEQVVDVFLACRFVAINRPQVVDSMEQYSFLHDFACSCLMQYEEYENCGSIVKSSRKTFLDTSVYANASDQKPAISAKPKPIRLGEF